MSTGLIVGVCALGAACILLGFLAGRHRASQGSPGPDWSDPRLRSLYAAVPAGVVVQSADGSIVQANDLAGELLGMTPDEVLGRTSFDPAWEMVDRDGRPISGEDHPSMITFRTGEPIRGAVRGLYSGDPATTRWISINTEPFFGKGSGTIEAVVSTFLDVTGEVAALRALESKRDQLAAYLDVAGIMLLALDTKGRIELINRHGAELLGAPQEELVGADWFSECLPADEAPRIKKVFTTLMAGESGVPERMENAILTRSGETRLIAWRNAVTRDDDGKITGVVCSAEDVTALRASQRAAEEAVAWQHAVIEGSPDAIFVSDAASRFVLVNGAASRLTGYSRDELLEMGVADFGGEASPEDIARTRKRILRGEHAIREIQLPRKDGTFVDVELNSLRVIIDGARYIHTAARDLTERRVLTHALRESESQYRLLFEEMMEGFALHEMIWDDAGEPVDYRFLDVNPAFERLTGLPRKEVLGRRVLEVLPGTEPFWIQRYGKVVRTGEPITFESRAGTLGRNFLVSAFRPRPNQFAVTFSDVTPRVRAEQELVASAGRLSLAQDVAGIGFMDIDLSTRTGYWSSRTYEILGLHPEEVEASLEAFVAVLLPESRASFLKSMEATRSGKTPPPFVYAAQTPTGRVLRIAGHSSITCSLEDGAERLLTVLRDVTQEETSRAERESLTRRLRALAERLASVREAERAALSRELHDGLGQILTSMRMDLSLLRSGLPPGRTDLEETIAALIETSDSSVDVVRDISSRLRPPILDVMGLAAALQWQVDEYRKKTSQRFHLDVAGCPEDLRGPSAVALFRIAQEALTNVLRHAPGSDVWITVGASGDSLTLEVRDDGRGATQESLESSSALGIMGMRERALSLGGSLHVGNHPDGGLAVRVEIPLRATPAGSENHA